MVNALLLALLFLASTQLIGMEESNKEIIPHTTASHQTYSFVPQIPELALSHDYRIPKSRHLQTALGALAPFWAKFAQNKLPNGDLENKLPAEISKDIYFHVFATKPVLKSEDNRYVGDYIDLVALEMDPQSLGRLEQTCKRMRFYVQQLKQDDTVAPRIIARHNNLFANEWCLKNFHQLFKKEKTYFSKTKNLHELYFQTKRAYLTSKEMSVSNFKKKLLNNKSFFDLSDETVSTIKTAPDMDTVHTLFAQANPDIAELIKKPTAELQKKLLEVRFITKRYVLKLLDQSALLSLLKALQPSVIPSYRSDDAVMIQRVLNQNKDKSHITPNYQQLMEHNLINEYYIVYSHLGDNYQPDKTVHKKFAQEPQIAFDFAHNDGKYFLWNEIVENAGEKIKNLISLGINPNIPLNNLGKRPLHITSEQGKLNAAKELLAHGANPNAKDCYGQTPLHTAANNSRFDIINLLLNNGADVNAQNECGATALHICVDKSMLSQAQALLDRGAHIDAKTTNGMTALSIAKQLNKKDFIDLINTYTSKQVRS